MFGQLEVQVILLAIAVYFPNQPRDAPSLSATVARVDFSQGLQQLLGLRNWWILASSYGVMTGITAAWSSILSIVLRPVVTDADTVAGNMGIYGGLAGQAAGIALSAFSDHIGGSKRRILLAMNVSMATASH